MPGVLQQLVPGHAISFTSYEAVVAGMRIALQSVNYEHGLEIGELRGSGPYVLRTTRGDYSANGSFSAYIEDMAALRKALQLLPPALATGYMEKSFAILCTYSEPVSGRTLVDRIAGARIIRERDGHQRGTDPLVVEVDIFIQRVIKGGLHAVVDNLGKPF